MSYYGRLYYFMDFISNNLYAVPDYNFVTFFLLCYQHITEINKFELDFRYCLVKLFKYFI